MSNDDRGRSHEGDRDMRQVREELRRKSEQEVNVIRVFGYEHEMWGSN